MVVTLDVVWPHQALDTFDWESDKCTRVKREGALKSSVLDALAGASNTSCRRRDGANRDTDPSCFAGWQMDRAQICSYHAVQYKITWKHALYNKHKQITIGPYWHFIL